MDRPGYELNTAKNTANVTLRHCCVIYQFLQYRVRKKSSLLRHLPPATDLTLMDVLDSHQLFVYVALPLPQTC